MKRVLLDFLSPGVVGRLRQIRGRASALMSPVQAAAIPSPQPFDFGNIIIGTTGLCNASCVHCPTNKGETDHLDRAPMPMGLFQRIIDQIAEKTNHSGRHLGFGLFGDGLADPWVVARAEYARKVLPHTSLAISTNGAAYNRPRHAELSSLVSVVALHIESIREDVYNDIMRPLRLRHVLKKIDMLMEDFAGKVHVTVPLSRANFEEKAKMDRYFRDRGAINVVFHGLSNRCSIDTAGRFRELSFDPQPIQCSRPTLNDLIVDWNGEVVVCCNDFSKKLPIGDLARQSLSEVLADARRQEIGDLFDARRHSEIETCKVCYGDCPSARMVSVDGPVDPPRQKAPA